MERFLTARRSWTPGLVGWLAVLLSCNSGTGPETSPVHGGPDNPAADGSYTEAIASPDGIASLEPVTPGSPAIQYARFAFKPLERHFTVVTWDQRGCGKSYRAGIDPRSLTFEQLFSDAHELILLMRARFGAPRVFLMGIS